MEGGRKTQPSNPFSLTAIGRKATKASLPIPGQSVSPSSSNDVIRETRITSWPADRMNVLEEG
ncbi:hypothetical protein [Bifidobacterium aquikefiri]|uniref:hypothetical protein n=1 Tax=Bifidobacterium aquikefiri TaxID=1653207 RepID=UPI0039E861CB